MVLKNTYEEVLASNIHIHSKVSESYNTCEPHFKPENIEKVASNLRPIFQMTSATKLLDLGCGTGFIIDIAKQYVKEIVGVDVTQAMLDKVDTSGDCKITLLNHDSGSVDVALNAFDVVTAYSFLHHLFDVRPTIETAFSALRQGGIFYADLEPNYYFWKAVCSLERHRDYDHIVRREIEEVAHKDEDIFSKFGIDKCVYNQAEYGKNIAGGYREEDLTRMLLDIGFHEVAFFYNWFLGQGVLINDETYSKELRFQYADVMNDVLQRSLPLSRSLFKYVGFIATK